MGKLGTGGGASAQESGLNELLICFFLRDLLFKSVRVEALGLKEICEFSGSLRLQGLWLRVCSSCLGVSGERPKSNERMTLSRHNIKAPRELRQT